VNRVYEREGTLGCCAREYPLGDQVNRAKVNRVFDKVNGGAREGALGQREGTLGCCAREYPLGDQVNRAKVNRDYEREGTLGCCAREYPLGDEGFGADKETSKGAAAFVNSTG